MKQDHTLSKLWSG